MTRALALIASALVAAALAPASDAASGDGLRPVRGTAARGLASAHPVGAVPADKRLRVVVTLAPRNGQLLSELAARSNGRPPLGKAQLKALFLPTPADVERLRGYLAARGLSFEGQAGLSASFSGDAAAAERAFGVQLARYRDAQGRVFRAPAGSIQLPATLASEVVNVDGLDSRAVMQPAAAIQPQSVDPKPSCSGSVAGTGAYAPADFADPGAYDFQSLLDGGYDGTGEAIAFVEFSDYKDTDISTFMDCFSLQTPVNRVNVGGGTTDTSGNVEVVLDVQTALGAAPGLDHGYVYVAPNDGTASMATVIDQIVSEQAGTVTVVSISWGACEKLLGPAEVSSANTALQLAAVAGMSVYVASGDNGAAGCAPEAMDDVVVDPASQPYATGVGGTSLDVSGGREETVWNNSSSGGGSGGGGLSRFWPMPSYQADAGISAPESSGDPCGLAAGLCRHVPDVSMDADPLIGYVIYCTTPGSHCSGWTRVGGTSAGAPLLAGMTADANEYSLANGGDRLGFANPFLYESFSGGSTFFNDVVSGSNDVAGNGKYAAGAGYDLASGLGSIDGAGFAADLAAYTAAEVASLDTTSLTASPTTSKTIAYGQAVTFGGTLTDMTAATPLEGETVYLEINDEDGFRLWRTRTDANGDWSISLTRPLRKRLQWQVWYLGSETAEGSSSAAHSIRVKPSLKTTSSAKSVDGRYVIAQDVTFKLYATTAPNLGGESLRAQWRPAGSPRWRSGGSAHVTATGRATLKAQWTGPGRYYARWRYAGSSSGNWLTATSPAKVFVVS